MSGSWRIMRIAGIDIDINFSWIIIVALLTFSSATTWFPTLAPQYASAIYWGMGFAAAILLFVSVLLHELAHALVAQWRGMPVKSITLFIFGGVTDIEREPQRARFEFQMAIVGPVASLALGLLCLTVSFSVAPQAPLALALLSYLGIVNLSLGVFNLIPGFPLDGGRVLRSIIWGATKNVRVATRWAAGIGQIVAYLFIAAGIALFFFSGDYLNGIWLAFIGWFLLHAGQAELQRVRLDDTMQGVRVSQVMQPATAVAPAEITVRELVDDYLLPLYANTLYIMSGGQLVGLITLADLRRLPHDRLGQYLARDVMLPLAQIQTVGPEQNLNAAIALLFQHDLYQVPVVQGGRLIGALSRDAIIRYLDIRQSLQAPSLKSTPTPSAPAKTAA